MILILVGAGAQPARGVSVPHRRRLPGQAQTEDEVLALPMRSRVAGYDDA